MIGIDGRSVGDGASVLVVAEIGVNHDGSVGRAVELVRIARDCGADAVKLQVFSADRLVHRSARLAEYQARTTDAADPTDLLRRYELPADAILRLAGEIRSAGLVPIATPFSPADVGVVRDAGCAAVKIASPDLVNLPLLRSAAGLGVPMLVSTGAATAVEIATSVNWLRPWGVAFALLHCVSSYPVGNADAHLGWISWLASEFGVPVGYSDHSESPLAGALAAGMGACIVERHLTYDRAAAGPDHSASSDPAQFAQYVSLIRQAEQLSGQGPRHVLACEQDVRAVSRQSLVAAGPLSPGRVVAGVDLTVQRPGTGIPAAEFDRAVGRTVGRPVAAGEMISWDVFEPPR